MKYTEIKIDLSTLKNNLKDIVISELADIGFESFKEEKQYLKAYIPLTHFREDNIKQLATQYNNFKYEKQDIAQQNWNAQWESSFNPIAIDRYCLIRAPFHETQPNFRHEVVIEPKMSFGTGHHQTTRLMIKLMKKSKIQNKKVLDMGCGTGILAIMALKTGARKVIGIDIDPWAAENTRENAIRNNVPLFPVKIGDAKTITDQYEVILANINRNILTSDLPIYVAHLKKHGIILFSGFYQSDADIIKTEATKNHLRFIEYMEEEKWVAMAFEKID